MKSNFNALLCHLFHQRYWNAVIRTECWPWLYRTTTTVYCEKCERIEREVVTVTKRRTVRKREVVR